MWIFRGTLKAARLWRQCATRSLSVASEPRTTAAAGSSPWVWCGTPNATASATAGCDRSTSSISTGETFSPLRLMSSLSRPRSVSTPLSSSWPWSPVPEPSADERRGVRLRVGLVSLDHVGAAYDHLADRTGCLKLAGVVHDPDIHAGPLAYRAGYAVAWRQWVRRHLVRGLRHTVGLDHRHAEGRLHMLHGGRGEGRAARADEAQAPRIRGGAPAPGPGQQRLKHRGHSGEPRGLILVYEGPEAHRVEAGRCDHGASRTESREGRRHQPVYVEQWHYAEGYVPVGEVVGLDDVLDGCGEVPVRQRHTLGAAGSPAGMQHERHVVGLWGRGFKALRRGLAAGFGRLQDDAALFVERGPDVQDRGRRRAAGLLSSVVPGDERLRVGVVHVEFELGGLVGRVQGGRRAGRRDRQERHDRLYAVGQDDGYPVSPGYAHCAELLREPPHLAPQRVVGQDGPPGGH